MKCMIFSYTQTHTRANSLSLSLTHTHIYMYVCMYIYIHISNNKKSCIAPLQNTIFRVHTYSKIVKRPHKHFEVF